MDNEPVVRTPTTAGSFAPIITRVWAMPSPATFSIPPIAALLERRLVGRRVIVDPFAGDSFVGTHRNDLRPMAVYNLEACDFLEVLRVSGVHADAVLFDPPYSPRQISEVYKAVGREVGRADTQNAALYKRVRDRLDTLLVPGGIAISCGWNSSGFGTTRGYALVEILLVAHGGAHNDTIVTVEEKLRG